VGVNEKVMILFKCTQRKDAGDHRSGKGCSILMCTNTVVVAHSVPQLQGEEGSLSHYYIQSLFRDPSRLLGDR